MTQDELIEQLAEKRHEDRKRLLTWLFEKCEMCRDGSYSIPADLSDKLKRQSVIPYVALSDSEKQTCRDEASHALPTIEEYTNKLIQQIESKHVNHVLDQYALAKMTVDLARKVSKIETEIFATRISDSKDRKRETLLGRVNELSGMAALGPVDQSFFLE